jgi:CBS domain containing-hemolysin-like protein
MPAALFHILALISVPVLVAANAFFVAAEFALVSVRRTRIDELVTAGVHGAPAARMAIDHLDDVIAATQLGITIASLALGWLGEPALAALFEPFFRFASGSLGLALTHTLAVVVSFTLITFLHVVLGELAPKAIALQRAEDTALRLAGPLLMFGRVFRPFIRMMNGAGNWVVDRMHLPPVSEAKKTHSVLELRMLVDETERAGVLPQDQARFVANVFRLSDKRVRDIMIPRESVATIALDAPAERVLAVAHETAHTRLPVWSGDPSRIVGLVNTKDLFYLFSLEGLVVVYDLMYPPVVLGPEQSVGAALHALRAKKRQMAVVNDPSGAFLGIVTIEDILEEIVGEMDDVNDTNPRIPRGDSIGSRPAD